MNPENFFNPRSIAVIGASNDKNKVGYALMSNILAGQKREVYPVSISEIEVLGLKAYKSIGEVPVDIDLALIAVRADFVPHVLADCGAKGIHSVIIISAGFKEIGEQGKILENAVRKVATENKISILGPNCLGIINAKTDLNASFGALKPLVGGISLISQSGALETSLIDRAVSEGIGFSKLISLGNEVDLNEIDFLKYFANDDDTKAILIYLEQLSDGPDFLRLAKEITKTKPIVILKAGRSPRGLKAVMSHTGSLVSEDSVFVAAMRQAGVIVVESMRELFGMAKLFQLGIFKPMQRFVILTNGGGPSVVAADQVDLSRSLSLVEFTSTMKDSLKKVLPPMAAFGNPIDIIGDALASRYEDALKILMEERDSDGIILILTPQMMTEAEATAQLVLKYRNTKPIIPVFLGGPTVESGIKLLKNNGLINFALPTDAIEALDNLANGIPKAAEASVSKMPVSDTIIHKMMSFDESLKLLNSYGMSLPGVLLKDKKHLVSAVSKFGSGPLVLKAISPDIIHKTDAGIIHLNVKGVEHAKKAWDAIKDKLDADFPNARLEGIFIQPMAKGREVIVGIKYDPTFGQTVLFGMGGIFTEALKDTSLRVAPVDHKEAMNMISSIKGFPILKGLRGQGPINFEALADIIVNISKLAVEHPEIKEIDFNPVVVTEEAATLVDVRMVI